MRDILFRAKAIDRDENREYRTNYKNGDWVYGLLTRHEDVWANATMTNEDGISNIDVAEQTLCQYTGLKDKNGTKIFEGDIVKITENGCMNGFIGIVEYNINSFDLKNIEDYDVYEGLEYYYEEQYEVIGNIHDNPELLEKVGD